MHSSDGSGLTMTVNTEERNNQLRGLWSDLKHALVKLNGFMLELNEHRAGAGIVIDIDEPAFGMSSDEIISDQNEWWLRTEAAYVALDAAYERHFGADGTRALSDFVAVYLARVLGDSVIFAHDTKLKALNIPQNPTQAGLDQAQAALTALTGGVKVN